MKTVQTYLISKMGPFSLFLNEGARVLGIVSNMGEPPDVHMVVENDHIGHSIQHRFTVVATHWESPSACYLGSFFFDPRQCRHVYFLGTA